MSSDPKRILVEADRVVVDFRTRGRRGVRAVDDVSVTLREGESVGVVGESGSGKTTLARTLMGLETPSSGSVSWSGDDVAGLGRREVRRRRTAFGVVFQDPFDSLNPRWTLRRNIIEPLLIHNDLGREEMNARVDELLATVRLSADYADRYPHQLSGGQAQRIGIARALVTRPSVLVLDEPTSALDAAVRVQILDLLGKLRTTLGLTYLYVSHDLPSVQRVTDRVVVMYRSKVVEQLTTAELFSAPSHAYTRSLLAAQLPDIVAGRRSADHGAL